MPLPTEVDLKWPPQDAYNSYDKYREHSAWYGGDVQELASVYASIASPGAKPKGLVNVVRSWFWGKQAIAPASRIRVHVPIASDISSTSADLLFGSGLPKFEAEDATVQSKLDEYAEWLAPAVLEGAEIASALGGTFLRSTWDKTVDPDRAIITPIHPDSAVPEFRFGRLMAVTFWHQVEDIDGAIYRHLERHEVGAVYHGLYKGTNDRLGKVVPLDEIDATADFAELVDRDSKIDTGIARLTAVYVPNMMPNRLARGSSLGRSDYAGAEGLMDALDETYTSWIRDLRLGRGRIIVPSEYLRTLPGGRGQGGWFDVDQEIFASLDGMNPADYAGGSPITLNQFEIRTEQHQATAMALIERIVSVGGYSASSFGLEGDKESQTATEIESRERRSFLTRDKKARYWAAALRDILVATLDLDKEHFNGPGSSAVSVTFDDAVRESGLQRATAIELLGRTSAISTYMKVKMANPTWAEDDVMAEVKRIKDDAEALVPDISSFVKPTPPAPADNKTQDKQPAPTAK